MVGDVDEILRKWCVRFRRRVSGTFHCCRIVTHSVARDGVVLGREGAEERKEFGVLESSDWDTKDEGDAGGVLE